MISILSTLLISTMVSVHNPTIPVILDREHNIVSEIVIPRESSGDVSGEVTVSLEGIPLRAVKDVRLVYTGTVSPLLSRSKSVVMHAHYRQWGGGESIWRGDRYAKDLCLRKPGRRDGTVTLSFDRPLVKGDNHFYVSLNVSSSKVSLADTFSCKVTSVKLGGEVMNITERGASSGRRYAIALRNHGDDGVDTYRIPGLVTTLSGDLLAVYDIRRDSSQDLQGDIDVGVQRSSDGGKTWSRMRVAMDMGEYGGLPEAQNGVGDPCVLVDGRSGDIFIFAIWAHGREGQTAIFSSKTGLDPIDVSQLVMVRSRDGGRTWSAPVNITSQVKDPATSTVFQGPGRGITMSDGTLVVPIQVWDSKKNPSAGIIYSKDGGDTWRISSMAAGNVCEDQVVELRPGTLLLNMRNFGNSDKTRKAYVSENLGQTWEPHVSNDVLPEPQCQASLLMSGTAPKDILLFANPASMSGRINFTVRTSEDFGATWPHALLLDEESGWGYSCMTMIDSGTIGILYEGSTTQLVFQAIRLADILSAKVAN